MNLTLVKDDNMVIVDGLALRFDLSPYNLNDELHAIQFLNGSGHIEYKDRLEKISSIDDYQAIITRHAELKAEQEKPLSLDEQKNRERSWAAHQLTLTDRILFVDSPYSDSDKQTITEYRSKLRNPAREATAGYPLEHWRPAFPAGIKWPL